MKEETRKKISQKLKGKKAWNVGINRTKIDKKKIGIGIKGLFNFIKDKEAKDILVRDCAYAELCIEQEMFKPAIILYGSIIEEILRTLLSSDETFLKLIKEAREKNVLEDSLIRKIDFLRDFRDYVHIFLEKQGDFEPTEGIALVAAEICKSICKEANKK